MKTKELLEIYDIERYLFEQVNEKFHKEEKLNAYDFFCIIIWKANRAKSKIAQKLLKKKEGEDLDKIVSCLTNGIFNAKDAKERFCILTEDYGFRLPMASAILTVLYPKDFTVYDVRVCDILLNEKGENYKNIAELKSKELWDNYLKYKNSVQCYFESSYNLSLRDKDRCLWAKSFDEQLKNDIKINFQKNEKNRE